MTSIVRPHQFVLKKNHAIAGDSKIAAHGITGGNHREQGHILAIATS